MTTTLKALKEIAASRAMSVEKTPHGEYRVTYPLAHYTGQGMTRSDAIAKREAQAAYESDATDAYHALRAMADDRDASEIAAARAARATRDPYTSATRGAAYAADLLSETDAGQALVTANRHLRDATDDEAREAWRIAAQIITRKIDVADAARHISRIIGGEKNVAMNVTQRALYDLINAARYDDTSALADALAGAAWRALHGDA